jgi:arginyl-tRNA synthetase
MNILTALRERFRSSLQALADPVEPWLEMIHPAQDPRFGDYQANLAMPLAKQLKQSPREIAARIVAQLRLDDMCEPPEVAGPGFINLRLKNDWLAAQLSCAVTDPRLGLPPASSPRTFVIDYSSPNVAKAMHVGHIRSTVIGDAICRTLRFLGHRVISDNHLGDWGTQFGMILYGYKHFVDRVQYDQHPVRELGRLYKLVHQLVEYHAALRELPDQQRRLADQLNQLADQESQGSAGQPWPPP